MKNPLKPFSKLAWICVIYGILLYPVFAAATSIPLVYSNDFAAPGNIGASASTQLSGLCALSAFRALPASNRYVYSFENWPASSADLGSNSYTFGFDLTGTVGTDQQVTITYTGAWSSSTHLSCYTSTAVSSPSHALGGLGDIGWDNAYAVTTMTFAKAVSAVGFAVYSGSNYYLRNSSTPSYPVSYTLSDGTVVNLGTKGASGATLSGGVNTFIGIIDSSGKGITSVNFNFTGTVLNTGQMFYIDDLSFALNTPVHCSVVNLSASHGFANQSNIAASASTQLAGLTSVSGFLASPQYRTYVYSFENWPGLSTDLG